MRRSAVSGRFRILGAALAAGVIGAAVSVIGGGAPAIADGEGDGDGDGERLAWAIAIHGGAGTIGKDVPDETRRRYVAGLRRALEQGRDLLVEGTPALDVVERVVRGMEDDPLFNAGKGAVYTADGSHELDAAIMDGETLAAGAVASVRTVKNPVSLARLVMERTPHVLLVGQGADRFAEEMGVDRVEQDYFHTERRRKAYERRRRAAERDERREKAREGGSTVGAVVLDQAGHLAAATSTGGLTLKKFGRVGDVPIIGAGTYANDLFCAVSCTGKGEEFIRHGVAREVAALMEHRGLTLEKAASSVIHETLAEGDGGLIAVGRDGSIALSFNTSGMFRAAADAGGRFEVSIWKTPEALEGD